MKSYLVCKNVESCENKTGGALVYMRLFQGRGGAGGGGLHFTPKFIISEKSMTIGS